MDLSLERRGVWPFKGDIRTLTVSVLVLRGHQHGGAVIEF